LLDRGRKPKTCLGFQPLTLSSALTASQPSQSHCSAEAVTQRAEGSAQSLSQVARQRSAELPVAGDLAVSGDLSGVIGEWQRVLALARTELGAPLRNPNPNS
jgi:hypothetical protein